MLRSKHSVVLVVRNSRNGIDNVLRQQNATTARARREGSQLDAMTIRDGHDSSLVSGWTSPVVNNHVRGNVVVPSRPRRDISGVREITAPGSRGPEGAAGGAGPSEKLAESVFDDGTQTALSQEMVEPLAQHGVKPDGGGRRLSHSATCVAHFDYRRNALASFLATASVGQRVIDLGLRLLDERLLRCHETSFRNVDGDSRRWVVGRRQEHGTLFIAGRGGEPGVETGAVLE